MSVIEAPAPTTTTVGDVLERIADLLEEFGHCQGYLTRPKFRLVTDPDVEAFCVGGALLRATADLTGNQDDPVATEAWEFVFPRAGMGGLTWNDVPGRTKAEVVARVREAAERAREAEA